MRPSIISRKSSRSNKSSSIHDVLTSKRFLVVVGLLASVLALVVLPNRQLQLDTSLMLMSPQQEEPSEDQYEETRHPEEQDLQQVQRRDTETDIDTTTAKDTSNTDDDDKPITIAYAISLIKCGDGKQNAAHGLLEAALVLRHSIHHISVRNSDSKSNYDYKLYAIVHRQAAECAQPLAQAGWQLVVVDPPVLTHEIRGDFLRKTIHKEVCCGADEFVKLQSFALPEPISVHVDIDFIFLKPMDTLFDAILFDKHSEQGKQARKALIDTRQVEVLDPTSTEAPTIPSKQIDAFIVRDWPSTHPGRHSPYQAGFIVARRDPTVVQECADIVREGNYTEGFGRDNGWGGLGYGGFIGARAMQGLLAYYYDVVRPNTHIQLDSCLYNHVGTSLKMGKRCRTGLPECADCRQTPLQDLYSIHYTACRKPWNCVAEPIPGGRTKGSSFGNALDTNIIDVDHCLKAVQIWHRYRNDLERRIATTLQQQQQPSHGSYQEDFFLGHCEGEKKYIPMQLPSTEEESSSSSVYDDVYRAEYRQEPQFYLKSEVE